MASVKETAAASHIGADPGIRKTVAFPGYCLSHDTAVSVSTENDVSHYYLSVR
jgi:hypothetical protein